MKNNDNKDQGECQFQKRRQSDTQNGIGVPDIITLGRFGRIVINIVAPRVASCSICKLLRNIQGV